ncbi:MAG TPA: hypothetical protein VJ508_04410, partial [Saprospiraceae bacterium]|nr:hypothetical protein [Saprospiraceae bacterium]
MVTQGCDPLTTGKAVTPLIAGACDPGSGAREIELTLRTADGLWGEPRVAPVPEGVAQVPCTLTYLRLNCKTPP